MAIKNQESAEDKLKWCEIQICLSYPFFASCICCMEVIICDKSPGKFNTACTDGAQIWFCRSYTDSLTRKECLFVLLHEILHGVLLHFDRKKERNHDLWNIATDYEINVALDEFNYNTLSQPANLYYDKKYAGKSAEWIYKHMPDKVVDMNKLIGEVIENSNLSEEEKQKLKEDLEKAIIRGSVMEEQQRQGRGNMPGCIQIIIDRLRKPVVTWDHMFHDWIRCHYAKDDYHWSRPNKRYMPHNIILPSLHSSSFGTLVVGLDTSGSVSDSMLMQFASEVQDVLDRIGFKRVLIMSCDAGVNNITELVSGDSIMDAKLSGRGGTDFIPVFEAIDNDDEIKSDIAGLIFFTDLDGTFPNEKGTKQIDINYPVLWVATGSGAAPFGTTINLKME